MKPARVIPPHKILTRELEARQWTSQELAQRSGIDQVIVLGLLSGMVAIAPHHTPGLAKAFGTSDEFWLNLLKNYERQKWMSLRDRYVPRN
ncbi:MAG TPA: hypothetical protein V6C63_11175 [Allocoleopsis sp.]